MTKFTGREHATIVGLGEHVTTIASPANRNHNFCVLYLRYLHIRAKLFRRLHDQ
jgi:hypothetical protein